MSKKKYFSSPCLKSIHLNHEYLDRCISDNSIFQGSEKKVKAKITEITNSPCLSYPFNKKGITHNFSASFNNRRPSCSFLSCKAAILILSLNRWLLSLHACPLSRGWGRGPCSRLKPRKGFRGFQTRTKRDLEVFYCIEEWFSELEREGFSLSESSQLRSQRFFQTFFFGSFFSFAFHKNCVIKVGKLGRLTKVKNNRWRCLRFAKD